MNDNTNPINPNQLLTRTQASEFLGLSKGTLEVWACNKRYPLKYIKVGRLVKYRMSDIIEFINIRTKYNDQSN